MADSTCPPRSRSGTTIVATSVYITELAPARSRGTLVALADISINFGILVGYVADFLIKRSLSDSPHLSWRVAMAGSGVMPVIFCFLYRSIPETPRFLMMKQRDAEAREVVRTVLCGGDRGETAKVMDALIVDRDRMLAESATEPGWAQVLRPADPAERRLVWTAVLIGMSQQFTGTEAILYYAPQIFSKLGSGTQFLANLGVGGCKFVGELVSAALAERVGRRGLLVVGNAVLVVAVFGIAVNFRFAGAAGSTVSIVLLSVIMFAFSIGAGPMTYVVVNEMVPLRSRAKTVATSVFMNRMASGTVALTFLTLKNAIGVANVFFLYGGVGALTTMFYVAAIPDLAGKSLETNPLGTAGGGGGGGNANNNPERQPLLAARPLGTGIQQPV